MKFKLLVVLAFVFSFTTRVNAQVQDSASAPPSEPAQVDNAAQRQTMTAPPAAKVAPPRPKNVDTVKGNAGKDVSIVPSTSPCANDLKSLAVTNKSATRTIKVGIEVQVVFMGRMTKKNIIVDNLSPNEVRAIGCSGCVSNATGKTCTTYRIFAAMYK